MTALLLCVLCQDGGIGDDVFSLGFDGTRMWTGGASVLTEEVTEEEKEEQKKKEKAQEEKEEGAKSKATSSTAVKHLSRQDDMVSMSPGLSPAESCDLTNEGVAVGDVVGCCIDLENREAWFTKNGQRMRGCLRFQDYNDMITPAISFSAGIK